MMQTTKYTSNETKSVLSYTNISNKSLILVRCTYTHHMYHLSEPSKSSVSLEKELTGRLTVSEAPVNDGYIK